LTGPNGWPSLGELHAGGNYDDDSNARVLGMANDTPVDGPDARDGMENWVLG